MVQCELETSEFVHNGKRYTIVGEQESLRTKRETRNATNPINECYQFTAIGGFANETDFDGSAEATCEKKNKYTPCFLPFIFVGKERALRDVDALPDDLFHLQRTVQCPIHRTLTATARWPAVKSRARNRRTLASATVIC